MNTLDQWEAEAKDQLENMTTKERILILIDLVRKKDEALKLAIEFKKAIRDDMLESGFAEEVVDRLATVNFKGALALTEKLDHTS